MIKLSEKYKKEVIPEMMKKFGYKNKMAVPRIEKTVINTSYGRLLSDKTGEETRKAIDLILQDLTLITGQKAVKTYARKAIAGFKIRQGLAIGAKVTLRGKKMFDFLEKLINIVLPRTRDFNGLSLQSVDEQGNLTLAIKEQIAFPETVQEKAKNIFSLEITVVSSAKNKEGGLNLFKLAGFPFKKD